MRNIVTEKRCSVCGEVKPLSEFRNRTDCNGVRYNCKECETGYNQKRFRGTRDDILEHYGSKCSCCGEERKEFLAVDHINGGGNKERKELKRHGSSFLLSVKERGFPDSYRILCHNCNSAIGFYGYCPHQKESRTT